MMPACSHTGTPRIPFDGFLHFTSSTTSGSACLIRFRTRSSVFPRQSLRALIRASISRDEGPAPFADLLFLLVVLAFFKIVLAAFAAPLQTPGSGFFVTVVTAARNEMSARQTDTIHGKEPQLTAALFLSYGKQRRIIATWAPYRPCPRFGRAPRCYRGPSHGAFQIGMREDAGHIRFRSRRMPEHMRLPRPCSQPAEERCRFRHRDQRT